MQKILRDDAKKYAFDWRDEPLLRVVPGEAFEIETWDASTGFFKTPDDKAIPGNRPGFDRNPPMANPIAGPVFIDGAERGDVLVVNIEDIEVADYSWIAIGPNRGPFGESTRWTELNDTPPQAFAGSGLSSQMIKCWSADMFSMICSFRLGHRMVRVSTLSLLPKPK